MKLRLSALLALLALGLAASSVAAPERADSTASVKVVSLTSPVEAGSSATLKVRVNPTSVTCRITVYYKSGPSEAQGLGPKRPRAGVVSWTWKVGTRTTPGRWRIVVNCGNAGSKTTYFRVT